ncbi:MAG: hypothetical protein ACR2FQ_00955 [Pseudonocardiaceae bacterium]
MNRPSGDEADIMRRRTFIRDMLSAAGLVIAPGVIDSAARLDPVDTSSASRARQVAELEARVHARGLDFPTVLTLDQLSALVRDYVAARDAARRAGIDHRRVYSSMAYLAAFIAANLSSWQEYGKAVLWYGEALDHAGRADDREAAGWIAARSTLLAVHRGDHRQAMHDAAYAVVTSPRGQLGAILGNALAASTAARMGHREVALMALRDAERATEYAGEETFTAYSCPWYRVGRFASEVYTQLGDTKRARAIQDQAWGAYPSGAATDRTFLALDRADCLRQEGYPREAARHATQTLLSLRPECAVPILLDRADEVADSIGTAGRSDTEELRHVLRRSRIIEG